MVGLPQDQQLGCNDTNNMVDWSAPVIESIFGYLKVYMSSVI